MVISSSFLNSYSVSCACRKGKKTRVQEIRDSHDGLDSDTSQSSVGTEGTSDDSMASQKRSTRAAAKKSSSTRSTRGSKAKEAEGTVKPILNIEAHLQQEHASSEVEKSTETDSESQDINEETQSKSNKSNRTPSSNSKQRDGVSSSTPKPLASPKLIPGFEKFNVKGKAKAYEEFISTTMESVNSSVDESHANSPARASKRSATPRTKQGFNSEVADGEIQKSHCTVTLTPGANKTEIPVNRSCRVMSDRETPDKQNMSHRRSSSSNKSRRSVDRRSQSKRRSSIAHGRLSLSKRRSSLARDRLSHSKLAANSPVSID